MPPRHVIRQRFHCLPACLGTLALVSLSLAQDVDLDVARQRTAFLKLVLSESQVLTDQYERALAKLESELSAAADYEQALLVKQRREELRAAYTGSATSAAASISLPPERTRLAGTVEVRGDSLTNWRSAGSQVEWAGVRVTPGASYHLELEAAMTVLPSAGRMQPQEKASFVFYEVSLLPGAQENRRSFDILAGRDETFTPLHIGPLSFSRDSVTLRLAPAAGYPANAISLRQCRLVPATPEPAAMTAAPLPEGDALVTAREALHRELSKVQKPVIANYQQALKTLPASTSEMKEAVEAETRRLAQLEQSANNSPGSILDRMARQLGGMAGFESLDGARYVSAATSSGDRFTVVHEGRQIQVRLMWIRCAQVDEKSPGRQEFVRHFGIDVDDAGILARTAREFTLGYLDGKPLRLLLRPVKDKDGFQPALVFLPEVGLYQNVLVDQGLAAVDPPPKIARFGMMERGLFDSLREHEAAARRLKNGAWALSGEDGK